AHDLVGRGLVNAALVVGAGIDAQHVARGRDEHVAALRIVDLDPREVERAVLRIARTRQAIDTALHGLGAVEGGEAILAHFTLGKDRILHGRRGHARSGDQGDLIDLFVALEAGASAGAVVLADEAGVVVSLGNRRGNRLEARNSTRLLGGGHFVGWGEI